MKQDPTHGIEALTTFAINAIRNAGQVGNG